MSGRAVVVIPAYNEEARIAEVVRRAARHADAVLVVDDGSLDHTADAAEAAGAIVVRHPMNLGKGAACRSGFHAAVRLGGTLIVTMDGDGQHDPEEIPRLLAAARSGKPGIVLGNRMSEVASMPWLRLATNRFLSLLVSLLARQRVRDSQCGFRCIDRAVLERVDYENNRFDAESEILVRAARAGFPIREVPVRTIYGGEISKINVFWDTLRFLRFFFRHLFRTPPVKNSPEREMSISAGLAVEPLPDKAAIRSGLSR